MRTTRILGLVAVLLMAFFVPAYADDRDIGALWVRQADRAGLAPPARKGADVSVALAQDGGRGE